MKPIIIANWKCNPESAKEARKLHSSIAIGAKKNTKAKTIISPPFVYLGILKNNTSAELCAQNIFWENKGAFTGEISSPMIKSLGVNYAIIGHSERRKYFEESDETINKKLKSALENKIIPIFCIGETGREREKGETEKVIERQLRIGLSGIPSVKFEKGIIAYEPVWAIGTGNPCDMEEAQKMCLAIRKFLSNIYSQPFSQKIPILYGGSVNSKNAEGYIKEAKMNGLLVGGASLIAKEFIDIVKNAA